MIDKVLAVKGKRRTACQWIRPDAFRCGECERGIVQVWMTDNRQRVFKDRKQCLVCKAKFKVTEVHR